MPRFPKNPLENGLNESTAIIPEQDTTEDVVSLELARMAKAKRDALKTFQTEERLDDLTSDLGAEVEQLHNDSIDKAGDGLTRKALEAIDKRIEQEASQLDEEGKQNIRENFETRRSELLKRAAHLETEARKNYYTKSLEKQAERLKEKIEKGEELNATAFSQLESKIEKADLPLDEKEEFSNLIQKEITLAENKAKLSQDNEARAKFFEENSNSAFEPDTHGKLKSFVIEKERGAIIDEATQTLSTFNEIDERVTKGGISFEELEPELNPLPSHLKTELKEKAQKHEDTAKLAISFRQNPQNKELGEKLADLLVEGKDIISDQEISDITVGFASRHGIVPKGIGEQLRRGAETHDPARLIASLSLANQLENFVPSLFTQEKFYNLRAKKSLLKTMEDRFPDDKQLLEYMGRIFAPEKILSSEEIAAQHSNWAQEYTAHFTESDKPEFTSHLMRALTLTNGAREEAIQIAEVMQSQGKKGHFLNWAPKRDVFYKRDKRGKVIHTRNGAPVIEITDMNKEHISSIIAGYSKHLKNREGLGDRLTKDSQLATIRRSESSGNPWAINPKSGARGLGQVTEETWFDLIRKFRTYTFLDIAKKFKLKVVKRNNEYDLTDKQSPQAKEMKRHLHLLAFDKDWNNAMIIELAEENARALASNKIPVNVRTLHILHFLGLGRGLKVLRAKPEQDFDKTLGRSNSKLIRNQNKEMLKNIKTIGHFIKLMNSKVSK